MPVMCPRAMPWYRQGNPWRRPTRSHLRTVSQVTSPTPASRNQSQIALRPTMYHSWSLWVSRSRSRTALRSGGGSRGLYLPRGTENLVRGRRLEVISGPSSYFGGIANSAQHPVITPGAHKAPDTAAQGFHRVNPLKNQQTLFLVRMVQVRRAAGARRIISVTYTLEAYWAHRTRCTPEGNPFSLGQIAVNGAILGFRVIALQRLAPLGRDPILGRSLSVQYECPNVSLLAGLGFLPETRGTDGTVPALAAGPARPHLAPAAKLVLISAHTPSLPVETPFVNPCSVSRQCFTGYTTISTLIYIRVRHSLTLLLYNCVGVPYFSEPY